MVLTPCSDYTYRKYILMKYKICFKHLTFCSKYKNRCNIRILDPWCIGRKYENLAMVLRLPLVGLHQYNDWDKFTSKGSTSCKEGVTFTSFLLIRALIRKGFVLYTHWYAVLIKQLTQSVYWIRPENRSPVSKMRQDKDSSVQKFIIANSFYRYTR